MEGGVEIYAHKSFDAHQQVVFANDNRSGLKAIIAIHRQGPGRALGGCRAKPSRTHLTHGWIKRPTRQ